MGGRGERGQGTAEYGGVLAVVALVVLGLVTSGVPHLVRDRAEGAVCRIVGSCDLAAAPVALATPAPADPADPPGGPAPPEDNGGTSWLQRGGAFLDGLIRGDFNRDDRTDDGWSEGLRATGQTASGLVVVGDLRDGAAAGTELVGSGGRDGWANLGWASFGAIPVAGDIGRAIRGGRRAFDAVQGGGDEVATVARPLEGRVLGPFDELGRPFTPAHARALGAHPPGTEFWAVYDVDTRTFSMAPADDVNEYALADAFERAIGADPEALHAFRTTLGQDGALRVDWTDNNRIPPADADEILDVLEGATGRPALVPSGAARPPDDPVGEIVDPPPLGP